MADRLIPIACVPDEQATADLIGGACTEALELIHESWGLGAPDDCRIYVHHAVRGYWLVELIEDKCPGFLKRKFSRDWRANTLEQEIAIELGMKPENFWSEIDTAIVDHFGRMPMTDANAQGG